MIEQMNIQIQQAHAALKGQVVCTPLLSFPALDALLGGRVYLKPENLQHTGSFKYRGALNHIRMLKGAKAPKSILAYSSGNHAQAVAKVAKDTNLPATIIMPADAPAIKIERTRALGANLVLYDRETQSREEVAENLPEAKASYLIPPYDHPLTIAGQGSIGLEVSEQLGGENLDQALICCGGGGLAAGATLGLQIAYPNLQSYVCEPEDFDDFTRSLEKKALQKNSRRSGSICDAIITPTPGTLTFSIAQSCGIRGAVVSDDQALAAVGYAAQNLRLILEPGGAVALAAALFGKVDLRGKSTLILLSGGNIDSDLLLRALELPLPSHWD